MAVVAGLVYSVMLCGYMSYETYVAMLKADSYGTTIGSMMTFACGAIAGVLFTLLRKGIA